MATERPPMQRQDTELRARCHDFLKRRDGARKISQQLPDTSVPRERCFPFKDGFFAWTISEYKEWGDEDDKNFLIEWNVEWAQGDHSQILKWKSSRPRIATDIRKDLGSDRYSESATVEYRTALVDLKQSDDSDYQTDIIWVQDLDGDGAAEIFIQNYIAAYEDLDEYTVDILSVHENELVPYRHTPAVHFQRVADVDNDGRPDLYTSGVYVGSTEPVCGGIDSRPAVPPVFVLHGLADGHFSATDATAQAMLKKWCPQPPNLAALARAARAKKQTAPYSLLEGFTRAIVCARAWGASPAVVLAGVRPACSVAPDGCPDPEKRGNKKCPAWVGELANKTPTVLLRP